MPCVFGSAVTYCTVMCVLLYYEQIEFNGDEDGDLSVSNAYRPDA